MVVIDTKSWTVSDEWKIEGAKNPAAWPSIWRDIASIPDAETR